MSDLITDLCAILEVQDLPLDVALVDLPEWDSLNALGIIALLDSKYKIQIDAEKLREFISIKDLVEYVLSKKN